MATAIFKDQPPDQNGLQKNRSADCNNVCAIPIPNGRIAKAYLASRWQRVFADAPSLKLPPVKNWMDRFAALDRTGGNGLVIEDALCQRSHLFAIGNIVQD